MKYLRRVEVVTRLDRIRHETEEKAQVGSILDVTYENQLIWFEHLIRMDKDSTVRRISDTKSKNRQRVVAVAKMNISDWKQKFSAE